LTEHNVFLDIPLYNELIKTLKVIAQNGSDAFYRGSVGQKMVESLNGSITMADLREYRIEERDPIFTNVGDFQV
jgi:gamma-glutamyltranspeptidase/glutathione hydrolase